MPAKKKTKKTKARKPKAKKAPASAGPEETSINRDLKRRKECPDCASMNLVFEPETEKLICQDCGSIFEELPPDFTRRYDEFDLF